MDLPHPGLVVAAISPIQAQVALVQLVAQNLEVVIRQVDLVQGQAALPLLAALVPVQLLVAVALLRPAVLLRLVALVQDQAALPQAVALVEELEAILLPALKLEAVPE